MEVTNNNASVAKSRGSIYAFLVEGFLQLPDDHFLTQVTSDRTQNFLNHYKNIDHSKIKHGIQTIQDFFKNLSQEKEIRPFALESMAVDRTKLIRPVNNKKLAAPYEGLYKKSSDIHTVILNVKRFYKKAGILPVSATQDSPDFFCTELDFMKQLCLIESSRKSHDIINLEREFLEKHIGSWITDYCKSALPVAATDFYKGLILFLDGFIDLEKQLISGI